MEDDEGKRIPFEISFYERSVLPLTEKIIYSIPTILSRCCDKTFVSKYKFPQKDPTAPC